MLRSSPFFNLVTIATLITHLFVSRYAAAATVPQTPANTPADEDINKAEKNEGKDGNKDWAEIIGILTVVRDHPLPSLYTFVINEYDGNDAFVRQSGCFQEAEHPGALTDYETPCVDTTKELGRRSGDMVFSDFLEYQNELRRMLWQDRYRDEILRETNTMVAPLLRTMHLTYPSMEEEAHLMVVVESNGMKSTAIRLAPDKDHRRMTRDTQRQQVFIREYRSDGSGFSIEPYVRG